MAVPHIFVISLKSRPDRLTNITTELKHHGLSYTIIDALTPERTEVKRMAVGAEKGDDAHNVNTTVAVLASHLLCHKTIASNNEDTKDIEDIEDIEEAIIMEDDIILHKDFVDQFTKVRENFPDSAELVYLCCIHGKPKRRVVWDGKNKDLKNLIRRNDPIVWGAQCYWVTRKFSEKVCHILNRPAAESLFRPRQYTSELISCLTIPYMTNPLLAVEDCFLSSEIRKRSDPFPDFFEWGFENYGVGTWRTSLLNFISSDTNSQDKDSSKSLSDFKLEEFSDYALIRIATVSDKLTPDDKKILISALSSRLSLRPEFKMLINNQYEAIEKLYKY
jgi:GR25 family glycosyltransferase involved in LPS biosynthesis